MDQQDRRDSVFLPPTQGRGVDTFAKSKEQITRSKG